MSNPKSIKTTFLIAFVCFSFSSPAARACLGIDITASQLNFGSYDPLSSFSRRSSFDIQIECLFDINLPLTFPLSYRVGIDSPLLGSNGMRSIKHQSLDYFLNYQLYSDSNLSQIIGSISSNDVINGVFQSISLDTTHMLTGHGYIPGNQNLPAGIYSDQLTITIEF